MCERIKVVFGFEFVFVIVCVFFLCVCLSASLSVGRIRQKVMHEFFRFWISC